MVGRIAIRFAAIAVLTIAAPLPCTAEAPQLTRDVLSWLPGDTESVVAAGTFTIRSSRNVSPYESMYPRKASIWRLRSMAISPLRLLEHGKYYKKLTGAKVRLAVGAGRRFEMLNNRGARRFQGCHVIICKDLGQIYDWMLDTLREDAKSISHVAGHEIFVFDSFLKNNKRVEEAGWEGVFVALPDNTTILCASHEGFLAEMLRRRQDPTQDRNWPESLDVWNHVDHSSTAWLARWFDGESASACVINVCPQGRAELQAVYWPSEHSPNGVRALAENRWSIEQVGLRPEIRESADGSAAVRLSFEPDDSQISIFSGRVLRFILSHTFADEFATPRTRDSIAADSTDQQQP
jgi:hypothetical protein